MAKRTKSELERLIAIRKNQLRAIRMEPETFEKIYGGKEGIEKRIDAILEEIYRYIKELEELEDRD